MAAHALELALDDLRPRSRPPSLGGSRSGLPSLTRRSPRALDLAIELPPDLFQRGRILDCSTNESIVRLPAWFHARRRMTVFAILARRC